MGSGFVKCQVIDPMLKQHYGDEAFYDEVKAQELSSLGLIRVITEEGDERAALTMTALADAAMARAPSHAPAYLVRGAGFRDDSEGHRIAWVQDFSKVGGAELSNYEVVSVGESLGYDIIGVTPGLFDPRVLEQADVVVLNNMFEFSGAQLNILRDFIHEKRVPYVKYEHDYRELRRLNISRPLFRDASLVVFLSPAHREEYHGALGWEATDRSICLPLAINPDAFVPVEGVEREEGLTIVPSVRKTNGDTLDKYLRTNPSRRLLIVGPCQFPLQQDRVEYVKSAPIHEMPALYSRCEYMLHQPIQKWAGERVFFEALLCGCTCVVDENVGHRSWIAEWQIETKAGRMVEVVEYLKQAPAKFWSAIQEVVRA